MKTRKKHPGAVALGKLGAAGRMKKMTPEQRSAVASIAGKAGGRGRGKAKQAA